MTYNCISNENIYGTLATNVDKINCCFSTLCFRHVLRKLKTTRYSYEQSIYLTQNSFLLMFNREKKHKHIKKHQTKSISKKQKLKTQSC